MDPEDRFTISIHQIPEPLLAVDERARIVSLNEPARRMLLLGERGAVGTPLSTLLWGEEAEVLEDLLRRGADTAVTAELCFRAGGGGTGVADATFWPLPDSDGKLRAVLLHDLSRYQGYHERLTCQAAEVEAIRAELGSRDEEGRRHAGEFKMALETRHRFYSSMSHELRTPVNAILGYNELLLEGIYGVMSAAQSNILRRSLRAASHLQELVNDLLDLARIEAGRLEVHPEIVNIAELIDDLLDSVRPLAEEHATRLRYHVQPGMPPLVADPRRIRKILLHLLTNAIKYGGGEPVWIRSGLAQPDGGEGEGGVRDSAFIEVIDHGPGIEPQDLDRIFTEFVRRDTGTDGTGLGLSIARALSQALGGTLMAESRPGEGSTFRLTIPLDSAEVDAHALPVGGETRH